jgi:hypothetical protein
MGMAELYLARPDPVIYNFINTQLISVIHNNLDKTWLAGPWWNGPVSFRTRTSLQYHEGNQEKLISFVFVKV